MKKIIIIIFFTLPLAGSAQSLFQSIKERAKQAAAKMVVDDVRLKAEKQLNADADANSKDSELVSKPAITAAPATSTNRRLQAYSHFDFVPGQAIFYSDNFVGGNIGEMPLGWNSNGNAVLVTLADIPGNWLKLTKNTTVLSANKTVAGKDFTVEFDMVCQLKNGSYVEPLIRFGMLSSGKLPANDNSLLKEPRGEKTVEFQIRTGFDQSTMLSINSFKDGHTDFTGPSQEDFTIEHYGTVVHVAMSFQHQRIRLWLNSSKVYDLPAAAPIDGNFNQFYYQVGTTNYKDAEMGFFINNLQMANGLPDTRSKLMDEGKYTTTGILFDLNKADLQLRSYGVLNEVAQVLKDNPALRLKIIGHTDVDGEAKANQELSLSRANAVREAFVKQYNIDGSRLSTEGKGASQPVADNKTIPGKAQNRRVEFIKF